MRRFLLSKVTGAILAVGVVFDAQAVATNTPTPSPTPALIAQFSSLATPYGTLDSSKQSVKVASCKTNSIDYSFSYATTLLNIYDNGTFALGLDTKLQDDLSFAIGGSNRTILTGIWSPIDKAGLNFRLYPDGDLALHDGGWDFLGRWISSYACSTSEDGIYLGVNASTLKVVTANIDAKSTRIVSGTPLPMGNGTLSLVFEGYASVVTNTPTPTNTPTQNPSLTSTPTPITTPTPTSTPLALNAFTAPLTVADKKLSYKLTSKGSWKITPTPSPTLTPIPTGYIWVYGSIGQEGAVGTTVLRAPPTVTLLLKGVPTACEATFTSYNCPVLPRPADSAPNVNDEVNLLVGGYTYSDSNNCYNNAVTMSPGPNTNIGPAEGTITADGTVDESTQFQFVVFGLSSTTELQAGLTFAIQNYTNNKCDSVTPTPTPTATTTVTPPP